MTSQELRQAFVDYFVRNGHVHLPSASLIPDQLSTTLFTIAGMEQFVPVFLGDAPAPAPRARGGQDEADGRLGVEEMTYEAT